MSDAPTALAPPGPAPPLAVAPAQPPALLVCAAGAAAMLGLSRAMFYTMAADGRLGPMSISFGRRRLWRVSELTEWVSHSPPCPAREVWLKEHQR
jgi:predicted DNA-binding transcriptional regulator AlpA